MPITLKDIQEIENIEFFYYLKYSFNTPDDIHYPESKLIYWSDLHNADKRNVDKVLG